MRSNRIVIAGVGIALALGMTAGTGVASAAAPVSAACSDARQQVGFAQARVDEAGSSRTRLGARVNSQKTARQAAINAGDVARVGQINVQLGSSTALYNTMDSSLASAQAQLVSSKAARSAAC